MSPILILGLVILLMSLIQSLRARRTLQKSRTMLQEATQYQYTADLDTKKGFVATRRKTAIEVVRDLEAQGVPYGSIGYAYGSTTDPEIIQWRENHPVQQAIRAQAGQRILDLAKDAAEKEKNNDS